MRVTFNNTIEKVIFFDNNTCVEYTPLSDYISVLRNKKRTKRRRKKFLSKCIQNIFLVLQS